MSISAQIHKREEAKETTTEHNPRPQWVSVLQGESKEKQGTRMYVRKSQIWQQPFTTSLLLGIISYRKRRQVFILPPQHEAPA
jgi:hypothetical protein